MNIQQINELLKTDYYTKEEFLEKADWGYISQSCKLSEEFIREFQDKVNWEDISYYQKLSEEFIREFQDKVNWFYVSSHQTPSEDFIREFKDKIGLDFKILLSKTIRRIYQRD